MGFPFHTLAQDEKTASEVFNVFRNGSGSWGLFGNGRDDASIEAEARVLKDCYDAGHTFCKILDTFIVDRRDTFGPGVRYFIDAIALGSSTYVTEINFYPAD